MSKKINSPFSMWGSWMGAILGLVLYVFNIRRQLLGGPSLPVCDPSDINNCIVYHTNNYIDYIFLSSSHIIVTLFGLLIYVGLGFLLGWGIQLLIRRLRK